ncbi:MAG: FtsQ-type POTRA domain-containing protein [Oscillospiraceae bacterium]|nr:FtsQ-type POTRA domain-containing protein [Oscillospiraceae bacterium]
MAQKKIKVNSREPWKRKRRRRRKSRFGFLYKFFCLILVCVAIVAGCIVFFKVNRIEVTGAQRYSEEEILEVAGVSEGDNLFLINKFSVINRLAEAMPYLDHIVIRRRLPDALVISVEECVPIGVISWQDGYWVVDQKGKLLEKVESPGSYPEVTGLSILTPVQGSELTLEADDPRREYYKALFGALVENDLVSHLQSIDLSEEGVAELEYEQRFTIRINTDCDYTYKIGFLKKVLESLQSNETGTIDYTGENPRYIPTAAENR